jgi:hypothetical protein
MRSEGQSIGSVVWFGVFFGLIGLVAVIVGAVLGLNSINFVGSTATATGTVVANTAAESCSHSRDYGTTCSTVFKPVVEFIAPSGETVRFTSDVGSQPARYGVGDSVPVRYPPNYPAGARIDGFVDLWMAPTIVGGLGLIFLAIGIGISVNEFRRPRERETVEDADVPTWGLKK